MTSAIRPDLDSVPRTLLGIAYARALEARRGGLLRDAKSVEIVERLDYDFRQLDEDDLAELSRFAVVVRTEIFDEAVLAFMRRFPHAQVVNLGVGLDTKFERLDNGLVHWIDLDLPEVIELRRNFFAESERYSMLSMSVTDYRWMDRVKSGGRGTLFIAEGLLMYFEGEQVRNLLSTLCDRFPGCEMLVEAISSLVFDAQVRRGNPEAAGEQGTAPLWALDDIGVVEGWDERLKCVKEFSLMLRYQYLWRSLLPEKHKDATFTKDHSNTVYHLQTVEPPGVDVERRGMSEGAVMPLRPGEAGG